MSTMKDLAKHTGLSIATISKYINGGNVLGENKILIENAIKKLNYRVNLTARSLKTQKSMTIGILIPSFENIFFTTISSEIENELIKYGYSTLFCDYREDEDLEKSKLKFLLNKNIDGLIMVPNKIDAETFKELNRDDIPVVFMDRMLKNLKSDLVLLDNAKASYDAVEQLIVRNHKKTGIILGPEELYTAKERLKGYQRVHEDYDLEVNPNYVKYGNYTIEGGYNMFVELWESKDRPTALFITNYEMTVGVIMAINKLDVKIPEELSLIGFDNMQLSQVVKPALSIVEQPLKNLGKKAADLLLTRLNGDKKNFPSINRLKADIKINDSVKEL